MSSLTSPSVGSLLGWDPLHLYIAGAAFLVCSMVISVLLLSTQKNKIDFNSGAFTYLKFFYATFLKPHSKDGDSQQDALESFYKTQVWISELELSFLVHTNE